MVIVVLGSDTICIVTLWLQQVFGYCCTGFRYHLYRKVVVGADVCLYSTSSFSLTGCEATLRFTCNYNITYVNLIIYGLWCFNNISAISWQSVLLGEETRVPEENHQPVASH